MKPIEYPQINRSLALTESVYKREQLSKNSSLLLKERYPSDQWLRITLADHRPRMQLRGKNLLVSLFTHFFPVDHSKTNFDVEIKGITHPDSSNCNHIKKKAY